MSTAMLSAHAHLRGARYWLVGGLIAAALVAALAPLPSVRSVTGRPMASETVTPAACPTLECPPCSGPRPAGEWLAESDAVFWGQVLAIRPADCDHWVDFRVLGVWKGPLLPQMTAWVGTLAWQCGQRFELGQDYVVFAQGDPARTLIVPFCFGIVEGDARQQLGPATPVPGMTCTPPACPCGRLVGECPNVRCEECTATPTPTAPELRPLCLPWLARAVPPGQATATATVAPAATHWPTAPVPSPGYPVTPGPSDPAAIELLRRSDEAMNRLGAVRALLEVYDRESPARFATAWSDAAFVAPDRRQYADRIDGRFWPIEYVEIGFDRWIREDQGPWRHLRLTVPFRWPLFPASRGLCLPCCAGGEDGYYHRVSGLVDLDGRKTWVVTYQSQLFGIEGWIHSFWTVWMAAETFRIHRIDLWDDDEWGQPVVRTLHYYDFDGPVVIQPPDAPSTTSPVPTRADHATAITR